MASPRPGQFHSREAPASARSRSRRVSSGNASSRISLPMHSLNSLALVAARIEALHRSHQPLRSASSTKRLRRIILAPAADRLLELGAHIGHHVAAAPLQKLEHGAAALDAVAFQMPVLKQPIELGLLDHRVGQGQHFRFPALDRHQLAIERKIQSLRRLARALRAPSRSHITRLLSFQYDTGRCLRMKAAEPRSIS